MPELIPGLVPGQTQFTLRDVINWFDENRRSTESIRRGFAFLGTPFALLIWFLPGWLYRITLKSTAWLWWPIAFVGGQARLAKNPSWFHSQIIETRWAQHSRIIAYVSLMIFLVSNIWNSFSDHGLPDNPFINVVGYAFVIDWAATPWQLLGAAGSLLSLLVLYAIDWVFKKYQVAIETNDSKLQSEAARQLTWIERLSRVRSIAFVVYCGIIGMQALLVFNSHSCWFMPPPSVQRLAETLYGSKVPKSQCANGHPKSQLNPLG